MKKYIKPYIFTYLTVFFANMVLHGFALRAYNDFHLEGITNRENIPFIIMPIDYIILTAALLYLVDKLVKRQDRRKAFIIGAFYGGILFLHVGLSNMFLLPKWPLAVVPTDTIASAIAFGLAAVVANKTLVRKSSSE